MTEKSTSCERAVHSGHAIDEETVLRLKKGDPAALIPPDDKIHPTPKVLAVDPKKCNGCKLCEIACSLFHEGEVNTEKSRIRVLEWDVKGIFLPVLCQHCVDAPCMAVCPKDAISWKDDWGRVVIDYDRCVSCQMCAAACAFGAIRFDRTRETVFKCDLCGGQPQCVNFCEPKAITFTYADRMPFARIRESACIMRRY